MKTYGDIFWKILKVIAGIFLILFGVVIICAVVASIIFKMDAFHGIAGPMFIIGALFLINRAAGFTFLNDKYVDSDSYIISGNRAYRESVPLETESFLKRKIWLGFISSACCAIIMILNVIFAFYPENN